MTTTPSPLHPFGPQEPPNDPRIFNRRQADGSYRPLSEFFDAPFKTPATPEPDGDMPSHDQYEDAADLLPLDPPTDIELYPGQLSVGKVVRLEDGRTGTIDCIRQSPMACEVGLKRYFVVGTGFQDWYLPVQIVWVYGSGNGVALTATKAAASA